VTAIFLGLSAGLSWGISDFFGGLASRRGRVAVCVALSQIVGTLILAMVLLARMEGPPPARELALGLAAGCFGGMGLVAFYRGLAIGTMSLVAPVAAMGAVIPVGSGLARGERPGALVALGVVLALVAAILVSRTGEAHSRRGLGHASVAAVGFGLFFALLAPAAETDALWATGAARCASVPLVAALALAFGGGVRPREGQVALIAGAGVLDVTANVLYAMGTQRGLTSVVAVLGSLYPVATVVLARSLLDERLGRAQMTGVAVALTGVALIAAG
jgi:drug/metabolite transporter (DMT)-like permease